MDSQTVSFLFKCTVNAEVGHLRTSERPLYDFNRYRKVWNGPARLTANHPQSGAAWCRTAVSQFRVPKAASQLLILDSVFPVSKYSAIMKDLRNKCVVPIHIYR